MRQQRCGNGGFIDHAAQQGGNRIGRRHKQDLADCSPSLEKLLIGLIFISPLCLVVLDQAIGSAAHDPVRSCRAAGILNILPDMFRDDRQTAGDLSQKWRVGSLQVNDHGSVVARLDFGDFIHGQPFERVLLQIGEGKTDVFHRQRSAVLPLDAGVQVESPLQAVRGAFPAVSQPGNDALLVFPDERVVNQAQVDITRPPGIEGERGRQSPIAADQVNFSCCIGDRPGVLLRQGPVVSKAAKKQKQRWQCQAD